MSVLLCMDCGLFHKLPDGAIGAALASAHGFAERHPGHRVHFAPTIDGLPSLPQGLGDWRGNADVKQALGSWAAFTITLASLATDANLLTGRESTAVANTSNLYLDYLIAGKVTVGTTPTTATRIEVWGYGEIGTSTYPDVMDGTDSAETVTSAGIKNVALKLISILDVDSATSDRGYFFGPQSLAASFSGIIPPNFGTFVTHNSGVNLNATGGNHFINYRGVFQTVV